MENLDSALPWATLHKSLYAVPDSSVVMPISQGTQLPGNTDSGNMVIVCVIVFGVISIVAYVAYNNWKKQQQARNWN